MQSPFCITLSKHTKQQQKFNIFKDLLHSKCYGHILCATFILQDHAPIVLLLLTAEN